MNISLSFQVRMCPQANQKHVQIQQKIQINLLIASKYCSKDKNVFENF